MYILHIVPKKTFPGPPLNTATISSAINPVQALFIDDANYGWHLRKSKSRFWCRGIFHIIKIFLGISVRLKRSVSSSIYSLIEKCTDFIWLSICVWLWSWSTTGPHLPSSFRPWCIYAPWLLTKHRCVPYSISWKTVGMPWHLFWVIYFSGFLKNYNKKK